MLFRAFYFAANKTCKDDTKPGAIHLMKKPASGKAGFFYKDGPAARRAGTLTAFENRSDGSFRPNGRRTSEYPGVTLQA